MINNERFTESMKRYCDYREKQDESNGIVFDMEVVAIEQRYPQISDYYKLLGRDRIKALGYKECALKNEVLLNASHDQICQRLRDLVSDG